MNEIWKPVVGYEGLYEVSNLGRVKSLSRIDSIGRKIKERILSQGKCKQGYLTVSLCKNGKPNSYYVHRLVAQAFIPNPDNYPEVNHKIDDFEHRSDNRVENLEWCTAEYNNTYNDKHKRVGEKLKGKKRESMKGSKNHKARKIKCITTGEIFDYMKEASEKYNIKQSNISSCCKGKLKSAGKHPITSEKMVWEYID